MSQSDQRPAKHIDVPHSKSEICLNLWCYVDDSGVVLRIAAKAYALSGSDQHKLSVLRALSASDHLTATLGQVPKQFKVVTPHGQLSNAINLSDIPTHQSAVFGPLMDEVERELPKGIRAVRGVYESFRLEIPKEPLVVVTTVYERSDGELVARVKTTI